MADSMASALPLDLVVRFSTSTADLVVSIPDAGRTTTLRLKQHIRKHLPPPARDSRLRLIHAGKVLVDTQSLVTGLGPAAVAPPPTAAHDGTQDKSDKAKGKQPLRRSDDQKHARAARVYIHCSIGDALTPSDLDAEAQQAQEADQALLLLLADPALPPTNPQSLPTTSPDASTTAPAPRGFDRLLHTGFTHAEVAHLRSQFLAIQAHTHTPDTMPTGPDLLALEERWLDNAPGATGPGGGEAGGLGAEDGGGLEDMLYGNLIGFFWPMGAMFWLMREEGVWSRRRQIAVLTGFLVNVTFGVLRVMV
ncbi:DSC E3 ubiquitin ligase complex subunit 3-like [Teratosphaeria destructans]|uniref:DSC E3 ubiquitin ligase complex subunit 3-like n=1 Tax=Teratosphaeria destructans TaxID=418781 RepID=A0A9W7SNR9_9PEZI|nr:DSC E3 ubiquitin ligase complex subunit 3-like [Teratosphaeria destructans]